MIDFIFDAFAATNALGFMFGAFVMLLIAAGLLGYWIYIRLASVRVKAKIIGLKSTSKERSDADWKKDYRNKPALETPEPIGDIFRKSFAKSPFKTILTSLLLSLFALMPFVFFYVGASMAINVTSLRLNGQEVQGKVVSYEETYDSESGTMYYPVVSYDVYQNGRQETMREKDRLGTGSRSYGMGEQVTIYYNPSEPDEFIINGIGRYAFFSLAFMGISSIFIGLFGMGLFAHKFKDRQEEDGGKKWKLRGIKGRHYLNQQYVPVYAFRAPNGEMVEIDGKNDSSNWLADKLPGRTVTLMVRRKKNGELHVKRPGLMLLIFGLICLAGGGLFLHAALSFFELNLAMGVIVLAGIGYAVFKIRGRFNELYEDWPDKETLKKDLKIEVSSNVGSTYEMSPAYINECMRLLDRQSLLGMIVVLFFGFGILFGGYELFKDMSGMSGNAMIARGEIVDTQSRSGSDGYTYYPVVAYRTIEGEEIRFQGSVGSSPPTFKVGDKVTVLYDPARPDKAIIDHGWLNWLPAIGLLSLGLLMIVFSIRMLLGIAIRARRRRL